VSCLDNGTFLRIYLRNYLYSSSYIYSITMLNSKNVATVAIVAIVLALGAAGMVPMMTQVSYAIAIPDCDHKCEG
jgi:branched-subunit amino acid permease